MKYGVPSVGGGYGVRPVRPTISCAGLSVFSSMMDVLRQAFRDIAQFGQEAATGGHVWILMFVGLVGVGIITAVRGKLTESWLWIPIVALAMWYAVYRWLQLPH